MPPRRQLFCFACKAPAVKRVHGMIACDECFEYLEPGNQNAEDSINALLNRINLKCSTCERPAEGYRYGVLACKTCGSFFRSQLKLGEKRKDACVGGVCKEPTPTYNLCTGCRFEFCKRMGMSQGEPQPKRLKRQEDVEVSAPLLQSSSGDTQGARRPAPQVPTPPPTPVLSSPPSPVGAPPAAPMLSSPPSPVEAPPVAHPDVLLARQVLNMMGPCRVCGTKADGVMGLVMTCTPCRNVMTDYLGGSRYPECHTPLLCAADWITACNHCKLQKFLKIGKDYAEYKENRN